MRTVIHSSSLTLTDGEGSRRHQSRLSRGRRDSRARRSTAAPPLAALGRRVGISARSYLRRPGLTEAWRTSDPARLPSPPDTIQENGRLPRGASLRSLERVWLKEHEAEYLGKWVALDGRRLVACGSSALQVLDAAAANGYEQPLIVHIPGEPELPFGGW